MRKGLVITLGVVALALVVSPGFAVAPIISCVPDIIVSDFEQSQTVDNNLFIFSNAIDLDEHVQDADTTDSSLLRWSFIQSTGPDITLNGIGTNTSGDVRAPGAFDIRTVSNMLTVRNEGWSPVAGTMPYPDPPSTEADSMLELYVSDGTNTGSQTVTVTSIDEDDAGPGDRLVGRSERTFTFDSGAEGWTWIADPANLTEPTHQATGGALQMTEASGGTNVVWGGWESPKDPAVAVPNRLGSILRGRFQLRSSVDSTNGENCPGFRTKAVTLPVTQSGGEWIADFLSQDFNASCEQWYQTPNQTHVAGRDPGTTGYTVNLYAWPEQTESLMTSTVVTYFGVDIADLYKSFQDDAGTIYIDQVDIDCVDRPNRNSPLATDVPALSTTDFSAWTTSIQPTGGGTMVQPTVSATATEMSIAVSPTSEYFDASIVGPAVPLTPGAVYRAIFTVSSTATPGGDVFGPRFRCGFVSSAFAASVDRDLQGGGLLSAIGPTPVPYEVYLEAPPADAAETEGMSVRFESYLGPHNTGFPFNADQEGTIRCTEVLVQELNMP